uniref:Cytochrome P450 CYP301B1 n=1 Tax=Nilaparvata lugens TaxID=108931 RepID=A0A0K0LB65_NILLU|nr:cytochrome P450 CYP301B1 [Nilaparvata lugens]
MKTQLLARLLRRRLNCHSQIKLRQKSSGVSSQVLPESADHGVTTNAAIGVKSYSEVPGPRPIPVLGNSWRFLPFVGTYEISRLDTVLWRLHREYGDIVKISNMLGRPDMVFLFDPRDIETIFRSEEKLPHRPSMPSLNYYKHVMRKDYFGEDAGVIAVHGENWYKFRRKVQQPLMQPKTAQLYIPSIEESADTFVERIRNIRDQNLEVPDDFLNEIHKWGLESIAKVALNVRLGCFDDKMADDSDTQQLIDAIDTFFSNVGNLELKIPFWRLFNTPTWNKYVNALDTIMRITQKYINQSMQDIEAKGVECTAYSSVLERVLAFNDNNTRVAVTLALDMFLVGIDTTSAAVASILYQLSQNQDKQEILVKEIDRVVPGDAKLTSKMLDEMKYLRACIKETLRMYPVVIGNGRLVTNDIVLGGYLIPKGVQVVFQHYVISNSDKYFANAAKFEPERWLKARSEAHHAFASLPFGFGRRMCLGRRFADLELETLLVKILKSYRIEYLYDKLEYRVQPMYTPYGPLKFKFTDRTVT